MVYTQPNGVMKSGWVLTFHGNSIGQLICDVMTKIRMGIARAEMLRKSYVIVAGGDDVLQSFPDKFDLERYKEESKNLGIPLGEFEVKPSFDGVEFFSNELRKGPMGWEYHPTRFTKHVEKLKRTKKEHLAAALSCHMLNHVWNVDRYKFFRSLFIGMRAEAPNDFPLSYLKTRSQLIAAVKGFEDDC